MLLETLIVIILALATIFLMHVFLIRMLTQSAFEESFIRSNVQQHLSRPVITHRQTVGKDVTKQEEDVTQSETDKTTEPSRNIESSASEFNFHSLEDELKQWMQQESKSWTEQNLTKELSTESMKATPIDSIFQTQQANASGVKLSTQQESSSSNTSQEQKEPSAKYSNTMNSGDLGNGLSAFDNMECSFATF